jgi:hypothetical protein
MTRRFDVQPATRECETGRNVQYTALASSPEATAPHAALPGAGMRVPGTAAMHSSLIAADIWHRCRQV